MSYYGSSMSGGAPVEHQKGTTIFVLGVLSIVCCGLFTGIPAWVMGSSARADVLARPGRYSNAGLITAGWVLGIIGTLLSCGGLLLYVLAGMAAYS